MTLADRVAKLGPDDLAELARHLMSFYGGDYAFERVVESFVDTLDEFDRTYRPEPAPEAVASEMLTRMLGRKPTAAELAAQLDEEDGR